METGGTAPAGGGRCWGRDPWGLPVRSPPRVAGGEGQIRQIELDHDRVVLRRQVRGMRMAVGIPVSAFCGVALRLVPPQGECPAAVTVTLDHPDRALSVPLFADCAGDDIGAIWKAWGRVLGLPLLVADRDGTLREPFGRVGGIAAAKPPPRRRRRTVLKRRRPSILLRRKPGRRPAIATVHRGEREIIARN